MKKAFAVLLALSTIILVVAPSLAFAATYGMNTNVFNPTILAGPLVICTGVATTVNTTQGTTQFPACQNLCQLIAQIANVIYFAIAVVLWVIAPIAVAVGGIMIMLGGANPTMLETGKKWITGAVWGIVIVLCAWLIIFSFISVFGKLGNYINGFGSASGGQIACTP